MHLRWPQFLVALALPVLVLPVHADLVDSGLMAAKVQPVAPLPARPFPLQDVHLLEGPFKTGQDIGAKYLLSLEPDRFLANFRKEAGLQPRAKQYGGWEARGVSGHSGGHYLSACALAYASTGDSQFLTRVNYFVTELDECQKANGNGYVAAIPDGKKIFGDIAAKRIGSAGFDLNGGWVPLYTMHKLFAGLRDAYRHCGNQNALAVETKLADWLEKTFSGLDEGQMQQILACEHGGMNEVLADLYADTGDQRYLALSRRFHHKAILDPLARGEDILPGKHANTQIPKLIGLATRYELAGDPNDRAAASFFWEDVVHHHTYVTGGHCDHEHFGPPDKLNDRLSDDTTETCNVYNMLKLTEHIFSWKPDSTVADFYERALLNQIRSSQHPDGRVIYNLTLKPGGTKHYQSLDDGFTCCVGTGMENHVKYGEGIYFHDDTGIWVNLFIASEVDWKKHGVKLSQETQWPLSDTTTLRVHSAKPQKFALRLRQPHWAKDGLHVKLNGVPLDTKANASGYVEIQRTWRTGDLVELQFPMSLRTESMPDNPNRIGIFYGPTLLAADLGAANNPDAGKPGFVPVLVSDGKPVSEWVKPVSLANQTFQTTGVGKPQEASLVPFYSLHDRSYTVYFDLFSQSDWSKREGELLALQKQESDLSARTLDVLRVGEMQPERDHGVKGERTGAGEGMGRKFRHATDGGWFSFDLKVDANKPMDLVLTYWGGEIGPRTFDILVDKKRLATQQLHNDKPGQFFDKTYSLSEEATKGKEKITVRLQGQPGNYAGGIFGARTLLRETP